MSEKKQVINDETALNELELFINEWVEKPEPKSELKEAYPLIFEAITNGNLVLNENVPVYSLKNPIKNDDGAISESEINFKTRITPTNQARIGKGLNIQLDQLQYALNCISYIIGKPLAMLDKFSKKDYNTIREIASVFM